MSDVQLVPQNWFVRHTLKQNGDVEFAVMKRVDSRELVDLVIEVKHGGGWLHNLLYGKFADRMADAMVRTQKRAWQLNEQYKQANGLLYRMQQQTKKENPHDD